MRANPKLRMRQHRMLRWLVLILAFSTLWPTQLRAQAAVLMEEPYGFFGLLNPTGHNAIYFARICADTPFHLRRCLPGEMGSVIARYQGMNHRDWVAIPLIPYLYAVDDLAEVPAQATGEQVQRMRAEYHANHMTALDPQIRPGNIVRGGWKHLAGVVYDRRIFVYRFETSEAEDGALIEKLNTSPNVSHFNLFYSNCADFTLKILNHYFPEHFKRAIWPDAGMATPKQTASRFLRFLQKHPERQLAVYEIPQIMGFRRHSRRNKGIAESLVTTSYLAPLYFLQPYIPAAIALHYVIQCRFRLHRGQPELLPPAHLAALSGYPPMPQDLQAEQPPAAEPTQLSAGTPQEPLAPTSRP